MYKQHPEFNPPEDENCKIWRYLDIPKFFWLLEKQSLYFSRADLLGDPFEGSIPSAKGQVHFKSIIDPRLPSKTHLPSQAEMWRDMCFICSFHINEHESAALWSMYTKANQGVAIQTTYKKLADSFKNYSENSVYIGTVKYIDYTTQTIDQTNSFNPMLHKMKSFEFERELRAVILLPEKYWDIPITNSENYPVGINVPIDLNTLIESIYLAPTTKPWIKELLTNIMNKNGIEKSPIQSILDSKPIF